MNYRKLFEDALGEAFKESFTKPTISGLLEKTGEKDKITITLCDYPSQFGPYENGIKTTVKVLRNYNHMDPSSYAEKTVFYTGNLRIAHSHSAYYTARTETIAGSNELKHKFQIKGATVDNAVPENIKLREWVERSR